MTELFPTLMSPLRIGDVRLRNRIVSSGHDTVMVRGGRVTDELIAYHEARAQGGVGLIVIQVAGVHETARYTSHVLMAIDDDCIPGYSVLAKAIHVHGSVVFGQLFHPGREVMESQDGSLPIALAPSAVPSERFHVMPRALLGYEIKEIQAGYATAAERLVNAGLDGVELVASHGYLPSQFLNPVSNRRVDDYGGSFDNRLRFLAEVLQMIRERIPSRTVVGLRMSIDERDPCGLTDEVAIEVIVRLSKMSLIDYISVTSGTSATLGGSDHIVPDMAWKNGYVAPLSQRVKELVSIPVMVAGRINQPQEAERILAFGQADACVMTRALICDPELPNLVGDGRIDDIRACIACNQACIGHFHAGYPISCIQHPETGRERLYGHRARVTQAKDILVVGGGPGGLKAASVSAQRGHRVTLCEARSTFGGQILLAQELPGREEFGGAAQNLFHEATRSGVDCIMNMQVDLEIVDSFSPDTVIVATGAKPYRPELEIIGEPLILDAWQIIKGTHVPKGRIAVVDWRGDWVGIGVARILSARGCQVTLATTGYAAGEALQQYVRDSLVAALHRERIDIIPLVRPYGMDGDAIFLQHVLTGDPIVIENIVATVLACGHQAENELLTMLQSTNYSVVGVGDCMAPRTVEEAVLDGLVAASSI